MDYKGVKGVGEKGYYFGYILKINIIGFVEGVVVECKKNRGVKNNFDYFGLRNWEIWEVVFIEMLVVLRNVVGEGYRIILVEWIYCFFNIKEVVIKKIELGR